MSQVRQPEDIANMIGACLAASAGLTGTQPPFQAELHKDFTGANTKTLDSPMEPEAELQHVYGAPAFTNGRGRISKLNEPFWAALYARDNVVLFEPDLAQFFYYDPNRGIYEEKSVDSIRMELAARIHKAAIEWQPSYPGLNELRNDASLRGVIKHLQGIAEKRDAFRNEVSVIHLANCDLHITDSGIVNVEISPRSKARWRLPFTYDPDADCPRFKEELLAPLDSAQQLVLQKVFALFLKGENTLHKILILDGEAGAGKTALALVFQEIFGPHKAGALRTQFLDDRFELGRIYDKSLLIGADVGPQFLQEAGAGALKKLTGSDYLEAELKTSNRRIPVYGRFNILITANVRLKIRLADDASAWLRRLIIIRYRKTRSGPPIPDFHKLLIKDEGPGILNWGLQGLELLRRDIENTGDIVLTEEISRTVKSLVEESDALRLFLENNVQTDKDFDLSIEELVKGFTAYCQSMNWSMERVGKIQRDLETLMMKLFGCAKRNDIKRHNGRSVRGYKGVKLLKTVEDPSETSENPWAGFLA